MTMRQITVTYHHEGASWWAESDDLPGFSAASHDLESLRSLTYEGVEFELDGDPFSMVERDEQGAAVNVRSVFAPVISQWWREYFGSTGTKAEGAPRATALVPAAHRLPANA